MVEHKPVSQHTVNQPGVSTFEPQTVVPGQTKVHFQNPQSETAFQGLTGIREGVPPSNEAVIVGIEQAKQSILSSQSLLSREGKTIQRDTLILLDLIKMIIEDRNSDEKMQQFLICFRNLSQKYAPEIGDDIRYGVKRAWLMFFSKGGYESSQKGTSRDIYQSIVGLRDFVFQIIRSADFREAVGEFFQYLQILAGEVSIDEKGSGSIVSKLASGIKSFGAESEEEHKEEKEEKKEGHKSKKSPETHDTSSNVVSSTGGSHNLQHKHEESLLPSHVHSEQELRKNQGKLTEPGEISKQEKYQEKQPLQMMEKGGTSGAYSTFQQPSPIVNVIIKDERGSSEIEEGKSSKKQGESKEWEPFHEKPLSSELSQKSSSSESKDVEYHPTSLYGTSHQGISPLQHSTEKGHYSDKNIVDDQYREPTQQSNIQAQQFRPEQQQQWKQYESQPFKQSEVRESSKIPQAPQQTTFIGEKEKPKHKYSEEHHTEEHPSKIASHEKSRREIEDSLIDRYIKLNKRFSKDPNYQRALYGLFNLFNQVKGLFGETATQGGEKTKTVERLREDDDFRSLLGFAKLILYEFSDRKMFDKWLDTTNAFFVHLKTDEKLKTVLRELMNDFRRYGNQPNLLESKQEKEQLRLRLWECRTVLEEKKNLDLTNNMLTYGRELLQTMRNDELNAEIRDRSQKLVSRLFLDEHGKFQLKPSALEQIRTILFVAIQEAVNNWNAIEIEGDDGSQYFKITNIVLKANDILPDDVKFKVKNRTSLRYEELRPTDRLAESATLIEAHLFGMTAHLKDVGFLFDRRSFPSISDRGFMDINFDRGGINAIIKLKARLSQNRPFYVKGIGVGVDSLHIKFKQAEKHKFMLKMLSPIIQSRVRRKIHDNLEQALNTNIRELIERLNDLIEQTVLEGNRMAGEGEEGGLVTGIMGRMGMIGKDTQRDDWSHEGGEYRQSQEGREHHHSPSSHDPSHKSYTTTHTTNVPTATPISDAHKQTISRAQASHTQKELDQGYVGHENVEKKTIVD